MNGALHLGHAFTVAKVEFAAGFERMRGKRVLLPWAFHLTGLPIKVGSALQVSLTWFHGKDSLLKLTRFFSLQASADKLVREMDMFGEDFSKYVEEEEAESLPTPTAPQNQTDIIASKLSTTNLSPPNTDDSAAEAAAAKLSASVGQDPSKGKKGKLAAKSTGLKYQFQIMELLGFDKKDEIKKFAEPRYWMDVFPERCVKDCDGMGSRIDWRRAFVTSELSLFNGWPRVLDRPTRLNLYSLGLSLPDSHVPTITADVNPYYDSFVRWQMNKLHALGHIKFGERYTIFSAFDDQPCMDHDRASGEGVGPQEYTAVKMEVLEWGTGVGEDVKEKLKGKKVSMVAGTLRPETM